MPKQFAQMSHLRNPVLGEFQNSAKSESLLGWFPLFTSCPPDYIFKTSIILFRISLPSCRGLTLVSVLRGKAQPKIPNVSSASVNPAAKQPGGLQALGFCRVRGFDVKRIASTKAPVVQMSNSRPVSQNRPTT